jgi:hypothetical protein
MRAKVLNNSFTLLTLSLTVLFFVSASYAKEGFDKKQQVQKYRVTQISEQDVKLDDTGMNTLLQSDKMQKLLTNENSQSEDFRIDYPTVDREDYPSIRKVDYPSIRKVDYPSIRKVDYPSIRKVDYPSIRKVDFPSFRKVDYPKASRFGAKTAK